MAAVDDENRAIVKEGQDEDAKHEAGDALV